MYFIVIIRNLNLLSGEKMELFNLLKELELLQWGIIVFFGLFAGSLLNVFNYRIPHMLMYDNAVLVRDNSIETTKEVSDILKKYKNFNMFFPASACPNCNHKIKWYENIPVLSYIFLKAKCSECKTNISIEYPFIETLNCILWVTAYCVFGWTHELLFICLMSSIVLSETMIDLKYKILPDTGLFIIFLIPLFLSSTGNFPINTQSILIESTMTYIFILSIVNLWEKIRKSEDDMFGRGDIKYLAALTAWIGSIGILNVIFYSVIFGFLTYLFIYFKNKENISDLIIPFAPSISISFILYFYEILPNLIEI